MEVYLDNAATTKPRKEVVSAVVQAMEACYANPSSLHSMGLKVEKEMKVIRKNMARVLGCSEKEIFFTSGGTESNNIGIKGIAAANSRKGKHIITSQIEHPSVLKVMESLEEDGFQVTYLPVDSAGFIELQDLEKALSQETILVSIMHVNNEVGSIQPIKQISEMIKRNSSHTLFHLDAIQSFGKLPINVTEIPVDSLALSGHKLHGPKGIGGLYVRKGTKIKPLLGGGNQELGLRSGTENTPGIFGLGKAVEIMWENREERMNTILRCKEYFIKGLKAQIKHIHLFWEKELDYAPHILAVAFLGVKSEVLLHSLEEEGIYVSSGSACSSKKRGRSHVLRAMNLKESIIDSTLRFSFSDETTVEELDYVIEKCVHHVEALRKIMR